MLFSTTQTITLSFNFIFFQPSSYDLDVFRSMFHKKKNSCQILLLIYGTVAGEHFLVADIALFNVIYLKKCN